MADDPFRLAVIVGSVREGRYGPRVAKWLIRQLNRRDDMKVDLIDRADWELPIVQQAHPVPTGRYSSAVVGEFAARVGAADAFVVVTPEYNHSYPAPCSPQRAQRLPYVAR